MQAPGRCGFGQPFVESHQGPGADSQGERQMKRVGGTQGAFCETKEEPLGFSMDGWTHSNGQEALVGEVVEEGRVESSQVF